MTRLYYIKLLVSFFFCFNCGKEGEGAIKIHIQIQNTFKKKKSQSIFITFHKMILLNQFLFTLVYFVQIFIRVKVNCRISLSTSFKAALRSKEARLKIHTDTQYLKLNKLTHLYKNYLRSLINKMRSF